MVVSTSIFMISPDVIFLCRHSFKNLSEAIFVSEFDLIGINHIKRNIKTPTKIWFNLETEHWYHTHAVRWKRFYDLSLKTLKKYIRFLDPKNYLYHESVHSTCNNSVLNFNHFAHESQMYKEYVDCRHITHSMMFNKVTVY